MSQLHLVRSILLVGLVFCSPLFSKDFFSEQVDDRDLKVRSIKYGPNDKMRYISHNKFKVDEKLLKPGKFFLKIEGIEDEFDLVQIDNQSAWNGYKNGIIQINIVNDGESFRGYFYLKTKKYIMFPAGPNLVSIMNIDQSFECGVSEEDKK